MTILSGIYNFIMEAGPPTDGPAYTNLPLLGPAWPMLLISAAYLLFVLKIGPNWMKTREAFQLKKALLIYNVAQILVNLLIFIGAIYITVSADELKLGCFLKLPNNHRLKWIEAWISYIYYIVKITDYMDTIFFVLRKSFKQITFLHVYHHVLMTLFSYMYLRFYGFGGHAGLVGIINSLVHAVMYTYYMLSALRPDTRQSLWWKNYITKMQIAQFIIILIQQTWPLIVRRDCNYPTAWLAFSVTQAIVMLYLFGNFYVKTYLRNGPAQQKKVQ